MHSGMFVFTAIERIVYGQPAAQALRAEVERLQAQRVFLIVSGAMNRTTDEVAKMREALGSRYAGLYDRMPSHTPRDAVLEVAQEARSAGADLIVTFGGGSVTDAGKLTQLCLRHGITEYEDLDARLDCQLAVWLAMSGRQGGIQMGASHAIGHVLGGSCDVPHGYTSCVMLAPVLRYNRSVNIDRQRLVAEAMGHPGEDAADVITAFVADLGLPGRLADVGVTPGQFAMVAEHAMHDGWLHTNPRKISNAGQVLEILKAAA